jgi:AbrB family looped-hinge helix DNA binding protein
MNLAKISANGQITVPVEIRKKLNLKEGDKILFFERNDGEVVINNASANAIINAQKAFEGAAKGFGAKSEDDVQRLVDKVRYGNKKHPKTMSVSEFLDSEAINASEQKPTLGL